MRIGSQSAVQPMRSSALDRTEVALQVEMQFDRIVRRQVTDELTCYLIAKSDVMIKMRVNLELHIRITVHRWLK